ncbi:hypothetical protein FOL47_002837 [Perkinsus chesapeaki]|uniref:tRNA dimethylallyltransferase n=1 Tax=Perkinsus chesapeaki TaxID=330153 RepID=A0A7J6MCH2_PERCH|nr:hypothetical protein FOL47_002837 [Perkinsus chesapeaki]
MSNHPDAKVVFVIGATGVGKTKMSLDLAQILEGEIVGADSIQMYKYFDIASAKPSRQEIGTVPHHLIDCVTPNEDYNVARYVSGATAAIEDIVSRGRTPIVVGGTVQYITALLWPMSALEQTVQPANSTSEISSSDEASSDLYAKLQAVNPVAATKLHPHDLRRIKRCLELGATTAESGELRYAGARVIWLTCDDKEVYRRRVSKRVDTMVSEGLQDELERLVVPGIKDRTLKWNRGPLQGIGYKEFREWVENPSTESWERCVEKVKTGTVKYSRQQVKWIRNKIEPFLEVCRIDTSRAGESWPELVSMASDFVKKETKKVAVIDKIEWKKYDCEICGKDGINGPNEWEQHLHSKLHKSRKRKAKRQLQAERSDV